MRTYFEMPLKFPIEEVMHHFSYRLANPDEFDDMHNDRTNSLETEDDGSVKLDRYIDFDIPGALKKMLPNDYQQLRERLHLNVTKRQEIFTFFFDNHESSFSVHCVSHFKPDGNSTIRDCDMTVTVKLPLVGNLVAKQVAGIFEKEIKKSHDTFAGYMASL